MVAEAMMDRADQYGWSVRPYQIHDVDELKKTLHESTVKNILLFCEYEELAHKVIREVSISTFLYNMQCSAISFKNGRKGTFLSLKSVDT